MVFPNDVVGEAAVITEGTAIAQEFLSQPLIKELQKIDAAIGRAASGAAGDIAEDGFCRFVYFERNEITDGLHLGQQISIAVIDIGMAADRTNFGAGEVFYEVLNAVFINETIGIDKDDDFVFCSFYAFGHTLSFSSVLFPVHDINVQNSLELLLNAKHFCEGAIGGSVIDRNDLDIFERIVYLTKASDRFSNVVFFVFSRNHKRYCRLVGRIRGCFTMEIGKEKAREDVESNDDTVESEEDIVGDVSCSNGFNQEDCIDNEKEQKPPSNVHEGGYI
jgi:hypothetical protein